MVQEDRLEAFIIKKTAISIYAYFNWIRLQQLQIMYFWRHLNLEYGLIQVDSSS
jgi:hypothetical protein